MGKIKTDGGFVGRVLSGDNSDSTEKKAADLNEWEAAINNGPTEEVNEIPTQDLKQKESKFWKDVYWTDSKGNRKLSKDRVAYVNGKQIIEGSLDDIYDEDGNIDREKEANKQKIKNGVKAAGMSAVSKNNIPTSVDAQEQMIKDVAKDLNTNEKTAAAQAGKYAGGNNSIPAMAEAPKVNKVENEPVASKSKSESKPSNDISTYEGVAKEIEDYKNIVDKIEDYYKDSIGSGLDDLSSRDKRILALDHIGTTMKNLAKMQPYFGSIYGRSHEEVGPGDEKSMLQNVVETNLKNGLDRRNKRMSAALDQQIKMSNYPSDLKMTLSEIANKNDLDFAQKKRLIEIELYKYYKETENDIYKHGQEAAIDTKENKQRINDQQNRDYRFTGKVDIPYVGSVGME
jgi:hypothetical protein